jgi:hypothetical protein
LTRVEQVQNILEVIGTFQCFGKKLRVSDGPIAPSANPRIAFLLRTRVIR